MQHLFGNGNKKVSSSSRIIKSQLQTNFYHFCIWSLRQNMLDIKCNIFMQYISKSFGTNANLEDVQQNNLPYAKFMNMICDLQCILPSACLHTCLYICLYMLNIYSFYIPQPWPSLLPCAGAGCGNMAIYIYLHIQHNFHWRFSFFVLYFLR